MIIYPKIKTETTLSLFHIPLNRFCRRYYELDVHREKNFYEKKNQYLPTIQIMIKVLISV